ncbi:putative 50S ribosome binding GTPase putative Dynamin family [Trypanosoma vivax]|nr:putative 50S ribosome binding GTPase putative Dynamin family [Trypanosoma vivax]
MLRHSHHVAKKWSIPLGYRKNEFLRKLRSPRATKPWRDRRISSSGQIEVAPVAKSHAPRGDLAVQPPIGIRNSCNEDMTDLARASVSPPCASDAEARIGHSSSAVALDAPPTTCASGDVLETAVQPPLVSLPFGRALNVNVEGVKSYEEGPVPIHLQQFRRSRREVAESILLPRHINLLFHKIMGWSEDIAEIETCGDTINLSDAPSSISEAKPKYSQLSEEQHQSGAKHLRRQYTNLVDKMKYGVLLDSYEKDKFAIEHQLEISGERFERKFLDWEGMHVLDQDPGTHMEEVRENKASIVIDQPSSFRIPVVNRDCCSGCGALLQDRDENSFGYVRRGDIERYIVERQRKMKVKAEYADRMSELQAHWKKHGRCVGEEWLDFMTQEEFDAFYRDRNSPFVCYRCHALENLGVEGRRRVWSAPDFTEKLRALREKKCVVVLVVDITDFPGTMVYDLPGLISMNNDVIIAVNKMDCIRNRSFNYSGKDKAVAACLLKEQYVRNWVTDIAVQFGLPRHQIKDVVPISAKRGWNIEKLIGTVEEASNLNLRRPVKPMMTYFVGVANVGKSSVLNAIAHKLYIPLPPHPESRKVYYTKKAKDGTEAVFWRWYTPPNVNQAEMIDIPSRHDKKASKLLTVSSLPGTTVEATAVRVSLTKGTSGEKAYLFDTPGLLPHWHRHSPLTLLQMRRTLIRKYRNPQCFILVPGNTLLLSGLAAIDIVKGTSRGLLFMVYTSQKVRSAIINTERSDEFWREQLGKALDPPGSLEQLGELRLTESKSYLFECYKRHRRRPKADVYVCGIGWAAFCVNEPCDVVLRVRTLPGVIHGIREPLRYKDLLAFRGWPRLRRRFSAIGVPVCEEGDDQSIATVVRLTAGGGAVRSEVDEPAIKILHKSTLPRPVSASSTPFDAVLDELGIPDVLEGGKVS